MKRLLFLILFVPSIVSAQTYQEYKTPYQRALEGAFLAPQHQPLYAPPVVPKHLQQAEFYRREAETQYLRELAIAEKSRNVDRMLGIKPQSEKTCTMIGLTPVCY